MIVQLSLAVGLAILVSALCSIFEAALYSIPLSHIEVLSQTNRRAGPLLKKLKGEIHRPITAILTLNTIANTTGAAVAGASASVVFGEQNLVWFSAAFTVSILLFSEILPKTIGVAYSKALGPWIAFPVYWMVKVLTPVIWVIQAITRLVQSKEKEALVSAQEVQAIATLSRRSGEIDRQEERVITNILELKNKTVREAMTPRTVTFTLSAHLPVRSAREFEEKWSSHSRVPVYNKDPDDIVGIVLRKDVLLAAAQEQDQGVTLLELIHPVHFVPESAKLSRVLLDFFEYRQHLFVVVDEYGGFTGVISLEDIIEEIVGREIMDESDKARDMRELAKNKRRLLQEEINRLKDDSQVGKQQGAD